MLQSNPDAAMAGAVPYLRLFGVTAGGAYLAKGALAAVRGTGRGQSRDTAVALAVSSPRPKPRPRQD